MAGNNDGHAYPAFHFPTSPDSSDDNNSESDDSDSSLDDMPPLIERGPIPGDSSDSNSENNSYHDESEEEEMDSDYEDIDDEDDDEGIDYDEIIDSEMLQVIQRMVFEGAWSDDEDEDDGDNGHRITCTCPVCLVKRIPGSINFTDEEETKNWGTEVPLHPEASPCAVCMEPETWTRTFVDMPCCGPASDTTTLYDTSSTRFCRKCFCRCITMHRCAVPCQESVVQMAGECPRCKQILVLQDSKTVNGQRNLNGPRPFYDRTKPQLPSSEALFWYVARDGKKENGKYLPYLVILALCSNPSYIPEELLFEHTETPEDLRTLCQWGLLRKKETLKEWLQKNKTVEKLNRILFNDLYLKPLSRLWGSLVSIVEPKLESAKTTIYDWKLSQIYRTVREKLRIEESQDGTAVYCMDPVLHSELRQFVLFYVHRSEDSEDDFDLMPPILEDGVPVTSEIMETLVMIEERNSRTSCALGAGASLQASFQALRKLHLWKGLWLINHAFSLLVLSTKHLGVPPLCDWRDPDEMCLWKDRSGSEPVEQASTIRRLLDSIVRIAALHKTRFRWHLLTGCNIILTIQIWKILRELFWIGWNLLVGASVCLVAGKIVGAFTAKRQRHEEWLVMAQIAACTFAVLHVGWNLGLHTSIKDMVYPHLKEEL